MEKKLKRVDDIIWRKIDDSCICFSKDEAEVEAELITLNCTATRIWEHCDGEKTANDIAQLMQEEFSASFEELYQDVSATLQSLEKMKLVE